MKFKTTRRAMQREDILIIPKTKLQNYLKVIGPVAYTEGMYGWNADLYKLERTYGHTDRKDIFYLCTGDRPFGSFKLSNENIARAEELDNFLRENVSKNNKRGIKYYCKEIEDILFNEYENIYV